jgi:hypothetical protein
MHAQAWLATALAICVGSSMGIACGSDTTSDGAGGSAGSAGAGASAGAAGRGDGGAAGADNGSGSGATGTGSGPEGGGTAGAGGKANGSGGRANGSGGRANGSGGRATSSGGATGGGSSCPPECLVNNTCVTSCGQTPRDYGCCPCPPGTVNARTCGASNTDAGSSKGVSCDPGAILCRRAPPVCAEGQVPSVDGTCYGPCVPVGDCVCQAPEDCPNGDEYTCHRSPGRCGPYV